MTLKPWQELTLVQTIVIVSPPLLLLCRVIQLAFGSGRKDRPRAVFSCPIAFQKAALVTQKTAVYIDGYNFYYGRLRNTPFKWLDLVQLFDGLLKIQGGVPGIEAVKFFSAHALARFASHGTASVQAQQAYHRALQTLHPERFSIILGTHSMDNSGALVPAFREGMPYDRSDRVRVWKIEEKNRCELGHGHVSGRGKRAVRPRRAVLQRL